MMHYLCLNYPWIMRPLIFILLISGAGTLIILISLIIVNKDDLINAHKEFFRYSMKGLL